MFVDHVNELVVLTQRLIFSLSADALQPFLNAWPMQSQSVSAPPPKPGSSLPVLSWLPRMATGVGSFADLACCLSRAAASLDWRQSYTEAQVGTQFLRNYGFAEIVGLTTARHSDRVACGFLLLGPDTLYPRHRHEAQEIYVPVSGTAQWLQGDDVWRSRSPGAIIYHARHEWHAMQTSAEPLLALYLWQSDTLQQKAHLD